VSGVACGRIRLKFCRAVQRKRPSSGLDVGSPSRQVLDAMQFPVHALERSREHLLAVERQLGGTGETSAAWLGFAPALTLLLAYQSAFLAAQLAQADAQRLQPVCVVLINRRVVREAHDLMLLVAQQTALEFAGYGHLGIIFRDQRSQSLGTGYTCEFYPSLLDLKRACDSDASFCTISGSKRGPVDM
jgi:hypothetical protein